MSKEQHFIGIVVWLILLGLIMFFAHPAFSQGWSQHPPPGQYDPYTGIKNKEGVSCCSGADCRIALPEEQFDIQPGGGYIDRTSGEFIDEGKVANSPDGSWHKCMQGQWRDGKWRPLEGKVRCLMLPVGGS